MGPHVHLQSVGMGERLAAKLTDVRPFPRMGQHV